MVKKLLLIFIFTGYVAAQDVYERNCIPCHKNLPTSLQQMFMLYLESYSSEKNVKTIMRYYLQHPSQSLSVMSDLFLDGYSIKKPANLNDEELDKAINSYWEKFKVFDKLK